VAASRGPKQLKDALVRPHERFAGAPTRAGATRSSCS